VNGVSCALNHLNGYRIYNLGESNVINLKNLVQMIENTLGKKALLTYLPLQEGDVNTTYADITKARSEIGYNPKYGIESGIKRFVEWFYENKAFLYK
jgi:UDP-glucuronate 4-epimerase